MHLAVTWCIDAVDHAVCGMLVGEEEIPTALHAEAVVRTPGKRA